MSCVESDLQYTYHWDDLYEILILYTQKYEFYISDYKSWSM